MNATLGVQICIRKQICTRLQIVHMNTAYYVLSAFCLKDTEGLIKVMRFQSPQVNTVTFTAFQMKKRDFFSSLKILM